MSGCVYIVQEPMVTGRSGQVRDRFDVTTLAAQYGTPHFLLEWSETKSIDGPALLHRLRSGLMHFCNDDYLLLVGNPTAIGLAVLIACEVNDGCARILQWQKEQKCYLTVLIDQFA